MSPENIRQRVKDEQEASDELDQNQSPSAVVLQTAPGHQKNAGLQAEKR